MNTVARITLAAAFSLTPAFAFAAAPDIIPAVAPLDITHVFILPVARDRHPRELLIPLQAPDATAPMIVIAPAAGAPSPRALPLPAAIPARTAVTGPTA